MRTTPAPSQNIPPAFGTNAGGTTHTLVTGKPQDATILPFIDGCTAQK